MLKLPHAYKCKPLKYTCVTVQSNIESVWTCKQYLLTILKF